MKILVVEDERLISLVLARMIAALGHDVLACMPSAEAALDFLDRNSADFVLLDIRLEGSMDGIEAATIIRKRWSIPLAFASAYMDSDTKARAAATEPIAMLGKPVREADLRRLFGDLLSA